MAGGCLLCVNYRDTKCGRSHEARVTLEMIMQKRRYHITGIGTLDCVGVSQSRRQVQFSYYRNLQDLLGYLGEENQSN